MNHPLHDPEISPESLLIHDPSEPDIDFSAPVVEEPSDFSAETPDPIPEEIAPVIDDDSVPPALEPVRPFANSVFKSPEAVLAEFGESFDADENFTGSVVEDYPSEIQSVIPGVAAAIAAKKEQKRIMKENKKIKKASKKLKGGGSNGAKSTANTFPMVELIAEQVRSSIPPELVARVKAAKSKKTIIGGSYPYEKCMKGADYDAEVELLQIELVKMQAWVARTGERVMMIFEGRDAAGKGGTIKRFTENLNPRSARIVALAKPSDQERGQWYFQRYVQNLPSAGEIAFFDRSWYNRAGVEHVMGFCSPHEYLEFMRQAPEFERMLVRSGIRVFKFWFSVSREEQLRRFLGRAKDPLKQWKLSPMDVESLGRWESYTKAKEAMLFYTDTADAPWTVIRSDDKNRARLAAMKFVLNSIPYEGKDESVVSEPDAKIIGLAKDIYETDEHAKAPIDS